MLVHGLGLGLGLEGSSDHVLEIISAKEPRSALVHNAIVLRDSPWESGIS